MAARPSFLCKEDEEPAVSFSGVSGEDQWIEHDLHHSYHQTEEPTSKTSTAGRGAYSRDNGLKSFTFKVIFLGDSSVGKTCLAMFYLNRKVQDTTQTTIAFDVKTKDIIIDGVPSTLQIWDTAGMEQFRKGLVTQYYRNIHGAIFVYDITRRETFVSVDEWLKEMKKYSRDSERIKMVLIGNQSDRSGERDVTTEEARLYANEHGMIFTELSAKNLESLSNLDNVILRLSEQMLAEREENSLTRSMHRVIRLRDVAVEDDWIVVNEIPEGPFPDYINNPRQRRFPRQQELTESIRNVFKRRSTSQQSRRDNKCQC